MSDVLLPDALPDLFDDELLDELISALGPQEDERASGKFEIEVEFAGKGTYCARYRDGELSGKKGFARGEPLFSARIPHGADVLLLKLLQEALDAYPHAPMLRTRQQKAKQLQKAQAETMLKSIEKLGEMGFDLVITGTDAGDLSLSFARGPLEEVTRTLSATVPLTDIEAVLQGKDPQQMASKVKLGGQKGLLTEVMAILGPLLR